MKMQIKKFLIGISLLSIITTDAFCADVTISNSVSGAGSSSGNKIGQSFTATKTGVVSKIRVASDTNTNETLRIYSGAGIGGTLLHEQNISLTDSTTDSNNYTFNEITIDSTVSITSGSIYTFAFSAGNEQLVYDDSNAYSGGILYMGSMAQAPFDLIFEVVQGDAAPATDATSTLSASSAVSEPVDLPTTKDSSAKAIDLFDFTITDGGSGDTFSTDISNIVVNTSGTGDFSKIKWRLNGADASNVEGVYSSSNNTITFSNLSISVADGASETYTINGYFSNPTGITDNATHILSIDASSDITVDTNKSTFAASTALTNGTGTKSTVAATKLIFRVSPSNEGVH